MLEKVLKVLDSTKTFLVDLLVERILDLSKIALLLNLIFRDLHIVNLGKQTVYFCSRVKIFFDRVLHIVIVPK